MTTGLSVPQTKGTFQLKGKITGCGKDSFYKAAKTSTNKDMRTVNFGVQVSKDSILYCTFNGMPQEYAYYSGKDKKAPKDAKNETVKVKWSERYTYKREGFRLIGMNLGLEKTLDEKGHEVNNKQYLVPFDAAEYVSENLEDDMSVFVKGNIEYGHYASQNGEVIHTVKLIPSQISLCKEIDFDAVDEKGKPYEVVADFEQPIVFQEIVKDTERDGVFNLSAQIVNYNSIENAEFVVEEQKLATNLRKNLKPFTYIKTWGNLRTVRNTDTVEVADDDGWGGSNPMKRQNAPYRVERLITGADPQSIDKENYTEDKIAQALEEIKNAEKKERAFESATSGTSNDEWGGKKPTDEDDTPWD